jgi:hypothetical protein
MVEHPTQFNYNKRSPDGKHDECGSCVIELTPPQRALLMGFKQTVMLTRRVRRLARRWSFTEPGGSYGMAR